MFVNINLILSHVKNVWIHSTGKRQVDDGDRTELVAIKRDLTPRNGIDDHGSTREGPSDDLRDFGENHHNHHNQRALQ